MGSKSKTRWYILRSMTQSLFLYRHAKAVVRIIGTRTTTMCDSVTRAISNRAHYAQPAGTGGTAVVLDDNRAGATAFGL